MATEGDGQRGDALLDDLVVGATHCVDVVDLEHDVPDALGGVRHGREGERVVTRVAVREGAEQRSELDVVRQLEAQQVEVEVTVLLVVVHELDDVAEATLTGDERRTGRRHEAALVDLLAVEQLHAQSVRIIEGDDAHRATVGRELEGLLGHGVAGVGEDLRKLGEVFRARDLPAQCRDAFGLAALDVEAAPRAIVAQAQAVRGALRDLQTDQLGGELLPRVEIPGRDHHVSETANLRHVPNPSCAPRSRESWETFVPTQFDDRMDLNASERGARASGRNVARRSRWTEHGLGVGAVPNETRRVSNAPAPFPASAHPEHPMRLRGSLLLTLAALSAFGPMSLDLYLPAFPSIADALHVTTGDIQLTFSACLIGLGLGQLVYGPLSDRYGRKPPLLAGLALYVVASLLCAIAPTLLALTGLRLLQGLGGCAGLVISRAIVRDCFEGVALARSFSVISSVSMLAPLVAPALGALVLHVASWRVMFVVIAAFGLACLGASFALPETHPSHRRTEHGVLQSLRFYGGLLRQRRFLVPASVTALGSATLLAYISSSSVVFMGEYGISPASFALVFALMAGSFIAGLRINMRLLGTHDPHTLMRVYLAIEVPALALLVALFALHAPRWSRHVSVARSPTRPPRRWSLSLAAPAPSRRCWAPCSSGSAESSPQCSPHSRSCPRWR